jgi:hypothetical protein
VVTSNDNRTKDNGHEGVWELLPWHANATLNAQEALRVERHVAVCAACQMELERCRQLRVAAKAVDLQAWSPSTRHFTQVLARLDSIEATQGATSRTGAALWSRACAWLQGTPGTARWVFAVQAGLVFVLGGALLMTFAPQPYQTMSRPDTQVALERARVRMMLADDITGGELRDLLRAVGGEIVQGPSATGVYTIALPFSKAETGSISRTVEMLRSSPKIRLAEPIDSRPPP